MNTDNTALIGLGNAGDTCGVEALDDNDINDDSNKIDPEILVYLVFLPTTGSNVAVAVLCS